MFKKVIGQQEASDSSQPSQSTPDHRSSSPAAASSASSSSAASESRPSPTPSSQVASSTGGTRNVLSSDVEIKGVVKFQHDLIVDGKIEGEIHSTGNLTVGENARLKAEIKTGTIVVYGKVHGNMTASDRVELKASAEVIGDIKAKFLTIEAGAIFVGKSTVGTPSQGASADSKPASSASSAPSPSSSPAPAAAGH